MTINKDTELKAKDSPLKDASKRYRVQKSTSRELLQYSQFSKDPFKPLNMKINTSA